MHIFRTPFPRNTSRWLLLLLAFLGPQPSAPYVGPLSLSPRTFLSAVFDFLRVCVIKSSCVALVKPQLRVLYSQILESVYQKETQTQVFSCKIYECFKNTYFEEYQRTTAYVYKRVLRLLSVVTRVTRWVLQ